MRNLAAAGLLVGHLALAAPLDAGAGGPPTATDANLVTALDVSDSIMRHEEWIEFAGMAHAIESADFLDAIDAGVHGRIGFAATVWSSDGPPVVVVPWTVIETEGDARRVAALLRAAREEHGFSARLRWADGLAARRGDDGSGPSLTHRTDISAALESSIQLMHAAPFVAVRAVINICGNGADNVAAGPRAARAQALAAGMVVNGLVIGARPGVADHYREHVQGGAGSFVLEVSDPKDLGAAMLEKFLRDLNVARVSLTIG